MAEIPDAPTHVLIAYDGSTGSGDAIRAAAQLFPQAQATVLFVPTEPAVHEHAALARIAVPDEVLIRAAREYESAARGRALDRVEHGRRLAARAGLRATGELASGPSAWRTIADMAAGLDADVIVCGTRGRGGVSRALLGSTSSSLLHHADRPVLIVPGGGGDLVGPTMIAYDGSDGARDAIAAAARLLPGRPAIVAHAWTSPMGRSFAGEELAAMPLPEVNEVTDDFAALLTAQGAETAEEGAALAREAGLSARPLAVEAVAGAWRELAAAAGREGAAVVVAGCRGRGALTSTVLGSVSAGLAHNAELPVLIVR